MAVNNYFTYIFIICSITILPQFDARTYERKYMEMGVISPPPPAGRAYVRTYVRGVGIYSAHVSPWTYVTVRHCVYDVFANLYSGPHMIQYMQ